MEKTKALAEAQGKIRYTLMNDMMFHMVMSKSKKALTGLVCALKGLQPSEVRSVKLLNPVDYNEVLGKHIVLDVRVEMNNREVLDIEIQVGKKDEWINRSMLYLCRTFDNLGASENYKKIKPATHVGIVDFDLFPEQPEFYARYLMMNVKNHNVYTPNFMLNVLSLRHIDKATEEDHKSQLVYWAKMFRAKTWEDLKLLAGQSGVFEEVYSKMAKVNADARQHYLMEAHEKYLHDLAGAQVGLKESRRELRKAKREIKEYKQEIEEHKQELEANKQELEASKKEIEANKQELEANKQELEANKQELEASKLEIEELRRQLSALQGA
ncbi:MAG: PD-(D/E)XK nuclease family transposase [Lachnospiraceae bacterium]|nr:PD-(D/E)XK nuclease family transposase [Lachnospiraceae bacterium]